MSTLQGKVAVITGAGRGIGREIALELARQGAKVVVNDYGVEADGSNPKSEVADNVVQEIRDLGGQAVANAESVADMNGAEKLIKTAIDEFEDLDILVCSAGIIRERMIFNMTEEDWDSVINVHLKGHFAPMHYAIKYMREKKKGRIITFTSPAGLEGSPGQANYSAAKAGIVGLTMSTALALGKYNITCNTISPLAETRMTHGMAKNAAFKNEIGNDNHPRHIAPLVAFLCSDNASNITGQILEVKNREISLWSHPQKLRSVYSHDGYWTVDKICQMYEKSLGQKDLTRFKTMDLKMPGTNTESISSR